jgi:hypothetical protein
VKEKMRLTAFAPETALRLAPALHLQASFEDGKRVAETLALSPVSGTKQKAALGEN